MKVTNASYPPFHEPSRNQALASRNRPLEELCLLEMETPPTKARRIKECDFHFGEVIGPIVYN